MHAQIAVCQACVWRLAENADACEREGVRGVKEESKGGEGAVIQPRNKLEKKKKMQRAVKRTSTSRTM